MEINASRAPCTVKLVRISCAPPNRSISMSATYHTNASHVLQCRTQPPMFNDTVWLGGIHDGFPLVAFDEYPKVRPKRPVNSLSEEAPLFQSQLTFGVLESMLEIKISENTLVYYNDEAGSFMISSKNLPALLDDWRHRIRALGTSEAYRQWAARIKKTFQHARGLLTIETLHPRFSVFRDALNPKQHGQVILQIASLLEALAASAMMFPNNMAGGTSSLLFIFPLVNEVKEEMSMNGWCPYTVTKLSSFDVCIFGYASTQHSLVHGHERCSYHECLRNNLDTSTYTAQHFVPGCNCQAFGPYGRDVIGLLENGKIPVMIYSKTDGNLLVDESTRIKYVAISHVWADGMGSVTENGLPSCQVKRLAALTQALEPGSGFWIDSLCVPEQRLARKRAIGLMAQTYKQAHAVVVIDSGIYAASKSNPREEKLLRILSSGWMQRLWTLQEAILAQRVIFLFKDGMETLDDLLPSGEEMFNSVLLGLASEIYRLRKYRREYFGISDVSKALRWRSTSRPSDETLAIAGLHDIDAFELASLPAEERMPQFLLRIRNLPHNIILLSGDKLDKIGFRWAPKTLMRNTGGGLSFTLTAANTAVCTPTGLLGEYSAVYFQNTLIDNEIQWFLKDASKARIYKVTGVTGAASKRYTCNVLLMTELPRSSGVVTCAAGLIDAKLFDHEEGRFTCQFVTRFLLTDISEEQLAREKNRILVDAKSGNMKIKLC